MNKLRLKCMTNRQKDIRYEIDPVSNCWNIISHRLDGGYGRITINNKKQQIHRILYEEFNNIIIPEGLVIMHTCDNPSCINPDHLVMGIPLDNNNDKINKGRERYCVGELNGRSKLIEQNVLYIISLLENTNESYAKISRVFNIDPSIIRKINEKKLWKHLHAETDIPYREIREQIGSNTSQAKLNENIVSKIKILLKEGIIKQKEIAKMFNVDPKSITNIKLGYTWKHVK